MVVPLWVNRDYLTTIDLGSSRCFFVMDSQKYDYLSHASQRREARLKTDIAQKWTRVCESVLGQKKSVWWKRFVKELNCMLEMKEVGSYRW